MKQLTIVIPYRGKDGENTEWNDHIQEIPSLVFTYSNILTDWWASDFNLGVNCVFLDTLCLLVIAPMLIGPSTARQILFSTFICISDNQSWYTPAITRFPYTMQFTCTIRFLESQYCKAFEIFRSAVSGFLPFKWLVDTGAIHISTSCKKEKKMKRN